MLLKNTPGRLTFTKVFIFFLLLGAIYFLGPFRMDTQEMRMASFTAEGYVRNSEGKPLKGAELVLSLDGGASSHLDDLFRIFEIKRSNDGSTEGLSGPDGEFFVEVKRKYEVRRSIFSLVSPEDPFKTMVLFARKEGYRQSSVEVDISAPTRDSRNNEDWRYTVNIIMTREGNI